MPTLSRTVISSWRSVAAPAALAVAAAGLAACASAPVAATGAAPAEFVVLTVSATDAGYPDDPGSVLIKPGCHMVEQRVCSSPVTRADTNVLWAPTVIACDGDEASVFVENVDDRDGTKVRSGLTAKMTVRPTGSGTLEVRYQFEELRDGVVVSEIPATTIHVADGQSVVVRTTRR